MEVPGLMRSCKCGLCLYQLVQVTISSCHDKWGWGVGEEYRSSMLCVEGHACTEKVTDKQNLNQYQYQFVDNTQIHIQMLRLSKCVSHKI